MILLAVSSVRESIVDPLLSWYISLIIKRLIFNIEVIIRKTDSKHIPARSTSHLTKRCQMLAALAGSAMAADNDASRFANVLTYFHRF
jgi:hypothetical protein